MSRRLYVCPEGVTPGDLGGDEQEEEDGVEGGHIAFNRDSCANFIQ